MPLDSELQPTGFLVDFLFSLPAMSWRTASKMDGIFKLAILVAFVILPCFNDAGWQPAAWKRSKTVNGKQDAVFRVAQGFDSSGKFQQRSRWVTLVLEYLGDDELPEGGIFALYGRALGFLWATNKRLLYAGRRAGLFSKQSVFIEHSYDRITSIETTTKPSALSVIKIKAGAETTEYKIMPTAARSDEFVELVRKKVSTTANKQTDSSSNDLVTQLERLSQLRDQGKLTVDEYTAAKAKILNL